MKRKKTQPETLYKAGKVLKPLEAVELLAIPTTKLAKQLKVVPQQVLEAKSVNKAKLTEGYHWFYYEVPNSTRMVVMWTREGVALMEKIFQRKREWHEKRAQKR